MMFIDHLALITLLVAHPFVGRKLTIPWEVSQRFANSCTKIFKYSVEFAGAGFPEYRCAKTRGALHWHFRVEQTLPQHCW